jgi:FADH2 O2-dependent halogenase
MPDYGVPEAAADAITDAPAGARFHAPSTAPPYPLDDAALHHVFDGGWMWVLRFGNGVTSAGVAVTDALAAELQLRDGAPAWARLLARYPSIAAQFADAEAIREFTWMPRLASHVSEAAGARWALLPSAAAFVDPLFSTGMPLTLLGIERLGRMLEQGELLGGARTTSAQGDATWSVDRYSRVTLAEADHTAGFIAGCYAAFPRFAEFTDYSMFYFAAASYGEMKRRLAGAAGPSAPAGEFLRVDDTAFAAALRRLSPAANTARVASATLNAQCSVPNRYAAEVGAAVERINVGRAHQRRRPVRSAQAQLVRRGRRRCDCRGGQAWCHRRSGTRPSRESGHCVARARGLTDATTRSAGCMYRHER